eukprot:124586-Pleurochrysis_carterae.AAC.3
MEGRAANSLVQGEGGWWNSVLRVVMEGRVTIGGLRQKNWAKERRGLKALVRVSARGQPRRAGEREEEAGRGAKGKEARVRARARVSEREGGMISGGRDRDEIHAERRRSDERLFTARLFTARG